MALRLYSSELLLLILLTSSVVGPPATARPSKGGRAEHGSMMFEVLRKVPVPPSCRSCSSYSPHKPCPPCPPHSGHGSFPERSSVVRQLAWTANTAWIPDEDKFIETSAKGGMDVRDGEEPKRRVQLRTTKTFLSLIPHTSSYKCLMDSNHNREQFAYDRLDI
ncbi:hypothetical protein MUK42_28943 [Musa troglodytarum]|uniref:Uncharacterized protein n=1 Tax=Musa troglodytarum TaxID=320322 RepID=A0A9E7FFK4_9LILI|nr:hypothetical protein MUK42_28943 [Musa troglodytarum]